MPRFAAAVIVVFSLLIAGCSKPDKPSPAASPTPRASSAPAKTDSPRDSSPAKVFSRKFESFTSLNDVLPHFNEMFLRSPFATLDNGKTWYLYPKLAVSGETQTANVVLKRFSDQPQEVLTLDANNWHLKAVPSSSTLSWLRWTTDEAGKDVCAIATFDTAAADAEPQNAVILPENSVAMDFVWFDARYAYVLLAFDEDLRDIRLAAVDSETDEVEYVVQTMGFPFLEDRDFVSVPGSISYSRETDVGYFSALGCIFAFQGKAAVGGLLLDGAGLLDLVSPVISDDGGILDFYATSPGCEDYFACAYDRQADSFHVYRDRRVPVMYADVAFLFFHHQFFFEGSYSTDLASFGKLVSIENGDRQVLVKVDKGTVALSRGAGNSFYGVSNKGFYHYRITDLRFDSGFRVKHWRAPKVVTAKYPDLSTPAATIRTFMASFQKADTNVWSICHADKAAKTWLAAVTKGVAARSLKMIGDLRTYTTFRRSVGGSEIAVLEGELQMFGDIIGTDVVKMRRLGGLWLIEKIAAEKNPAETPPQDDSRPSE